MDIVKEMGYTHRMLSRRPKEDHERDTEILMIAEADRSEGRGLLTQCVPSVDVASKRDHIYDGDCERRGWKRRGGKGGHVHVHKDRWGVEELQYTTSTAKDRFV